MTDHDRPARTNPNAEPGSPFPDDTADPFGVVVAPVAASTVAATRPSPHRLAAVRAGMLVGTALLVVLGAAVALGASPNASPAVGAAPTAAASPDPGTGKPFKGPRGGFGPFGGLPPFGGFGSGGFGPGGFGPGKGVGGPRPLGQVTVTAISGSSVSLTTDDGWTRTITVSGSTTITKGGAAAKLADLAVGDLVRFAETRNADGSYAITTLDIVEPQVSGTVTAVDGASITITQRDGAATTVRTTGSTTYHLDAGDGQPADVTVGSLIVASGERASDGTLTASSVWVRLPRIVGTVTKATTDTLTVQRPDGSSMTIHVSGQASLRILGVDGPTLSDISAGMVVVVEGRQRADGSIDARTIVAGKHGPGRGPGNGHDKGAKPDPPASPAPGASGGTSG